MQMIGDCGILCPYHRWFFWYGMQVIFNWWNVLCSSFSCDMNDIRMPWFILQFMYKLNLLINKEKVVPYLNTMWSMMMSTNFCHLWFRWLWTRTIIKSFRRFLMPVFLHACEQQSDARTCMKTDSIFFVIKIKNSRK